MGVLGAGSVRGGIRPRGSFREPLPEVSPLPTQAGYGILTGMNTPSLPEHVRENRQYWNDRAHEWVASGERQWAQTEPTWGSWDVPEGELGLLPADMTGLQAIELGCGTAYVSAWMIRRGASVVGIDNSQKQLETARRLAAEHGLSLTLVHGNAEDVPYADASFDFAISEYGAATWCDPYKWIPEARRLLRSGGRLVFLGNHPLTYLCAPPRGDACDSRLYSPYFGMHRQDWTEVEVDPGGIEFNLTISGWMRLFRETGFELLDYHELQAPDPSKGLRFTVQAEWAHQWPSEHVWVLRAT